MPRIDGWALRVAWLLGLALLAGCLEHEAVDLSGKACPCAEGWTCDDATRTCVRGGGEAPRDAGPAVDAGPGGEDAGPAVDAGPGEDAGPVETGTFWFEAEDGTLEAPMQTGDDPDASGGSYATVDPASPSTTDARPATGKVSFTFTVTDAADFRAWGRVRVTTENDDSFWVCVDDCMKEEQWNNLSTLDVVGDWTWDDVHDSITDDTVAVTWTLDAGEHTLHVYYREVGAQLDKVLITDDPVLVPTGLGE